MMIVSSMLSMGSLTWAIIYYLATAPPRQSPSHPPYTVHVRVVPEQPSVLQHKKEIKQHTIDIDISDDICIGKSENNTSAVIIQPKPT